MILNKKIIFCQGDKMVSTTMETLSIKTDNKFRTLITKQAYKKGDVICEMPSVMASGNKTVVSGGSLIIALKALPVKAGTYAASAAFPIAPRMIITMIHAYGRACEMIQRMADVWL